ncbi:MAG: sensor histidine kinase [Clostridiales bacterium]|jgi:CheY-like chemotaxis protein|nr:sensor histidine kinase [Clostridiales bacterium]
MKLLDICNKRISLIRFRGLTMEAFEKSKIISTLTSGIVHDMNNVLTTILGYTEIILSNDSCSECWSEIEIIKKIALDGAEIAKRVKEFVKAKDEGKKVFNIYESIQTAIIITKPIWYNQAQIKGKNITFNYSGELPILTYGNESEFREALVNMIFNAIDAIHDNGFIQINVYKNENQAIISIKDNGSGMTEETKNKIFKPYYTTKGENGSGLGLSIVYKTITEMDGKIEVVSNIGEGTEFKIFLPVIGEKEDDKSKIEKITSKRYLNILIIDDQIEICSVVKEMLAKILDGKIEICTKGKDAFNLLKIYNYDLVITDIAMPDVNGIELIKYIKKSKPETQVIAMTGWEGSIDKEKDNKPDFVLSKPFTIEDLENAINKIFELRDNLVV